MSASRSGDKGLASPLLLGGPRAARERRRLPAATLPGRRPSAIIHRPGSGEGRPRPRRDGPRPLSAARPVGRPSVHPRLSLPRLGRPPGPTPAEHVYYTRHLFLKAFFPLSSRLFYESTKPVYTLTHSRHVLHPRTHEPLTLLPVPPLPLSLGAPVPFSLSLEPPAPAAFSFARAKRPRLVTHSHTHRRCRYSSPAARESSYHSYARIGGERTAILRLSFFVPPSSSARSVELTLEKTICASF